MSVSVKLVDTDFVEVDGDLNDEIFQEIVEIHNILFPFLTIDNNSTYLQLKISQFVLVFSNLESLENINLDEDIKTILINHLNQQKFVTNEMDYSNPKEDDLVNIEKELLVSGFKRNLLNHQLNNLYKLINIPNGANFSVPGAGKTTVSIALIALLNNDVTFVFVPNLGVMTSWEDDLKDCFEQLKIPKLIKITNENSLKIKSTLENIDEKSIVLLTYDKIARNDRNFNILKNFVIKNPNNHIILDESHRIKSAITDIGNEPSKRGVYLLKLAMFFKRRDILSGTPMTQDINDLVSQFSFLYPLTNVGSRLSSNEEKPSNVIKNFYVRTKKSDLELPKSIDHPQISVEMSENQAAFYSLLTKKERETYISWAKGKKPINKKQFESVGKAITRLIELSIDPFNVACKLKKKDLDFSFSKSENEQYNNALENLLKEGAVSNKMQKAIDLTSRLIQEDEKVILWCYFVNSIKVLNDAIIKQLGINPLLLFGSSEMTTADVIKNFNTNKDFPVLIANLESGGEGISLHKQCRNAIYVSRTFKAGQYLQSRDRIHRVGMPLDKDVNYYFLESVYPDDYIVPNIDKKISENLRKKLILQSEVVEDEEVRKTADYETTTRDNSQYSSADLKFWVDACIENK
tara:strand:- start:4017 stop:5918 length:1902 start_codon:yes stop_codon:yes gene_type:complete